VGLSGDSVSNRLLFTGAVEHSLDDKGRLVVPSRYRERLGAGFFITITDPDGCLALFPAAAFHEFCAKLQAAPDRDENFRDFMRVMFALSDEVSCDAQGRVNLTAALREWAKIEKDVVSIGVMDHVEVWAKERYRRHVDERGSLPDYATKLGLF
jgi:MraZ protein